jgi:CRP/FNR family transcriptional regulator, cyclic AMP receptor protein
MPQSTVDPELLERLVPFCWLTGEQRSAILPHVVRRKYPARSVIQNAGVASEGIYVLICGRVSAVHQNADGHELVANTLVPGDAFGELGLLDGQSCPATFRAEILSEVAHAPRCVVLRCLEENPWAAVRLIRLVTDRLCEAQHKLAQIALSSVYERVAATIVANTADDNGETIVGIGTEQIARVVASSREMVTRVISRMLEEGLVRRPAHRRLVVADVERLRRAAGTAIYSRL